MKVTNPATEEVIGEVPEDGPKEVEAKIERARRAQPAWAATPLATRTAAVRRWKDLLAARKEELALTLTREMGKPISQARNELSAMAGRIDFFIEHAADVMADEVVARGGRVEERIAHEPLGVVVNISAWNYPYFVGSNVFLPALLTGNTVLYKPSEHAGLTGRHIAGLLHEAGVPADVFIPVYGTGETGQLLIARGIDAVFFTGSYATGRRIAEAVAGRLVKVQLELGGKDPTYVCDDVDVLAAAHSLAEGVFYNAGQSCCSVERLYVHHRVAGAFNDALMAEARWLVAGDPTDERTTLGPLARREQLAVLADQVKDAVAKGGRLLTGGKRQPRRGFFFEPTVIADATGEMLVMRHESFGPIVGVQAVADDDEAVSLMNDSEYGLTAGVYTRDRGRAEAILRRVDAGSVYWNCCDRVSPRLPWTGRKHSGAGSTLSTLGIRAFLRPKAWHLQSP